MGLTTVIALLFVIAIGIVSFIGFKDKFLVEQYKFSVSKVRFQKEYYRIITATFFHKNVYQLLVNLLNLYIFGSFLAPIVGMGRFIGLFTIGAVSGTLLTMIIYRNAKQFTAIGANGAVGGIVFAATALQPFTPLSLFGILPAIPLWVFVLVYVVLAFGIRRQAGIGYEAHLSGALIAMLSALAMYPVVLSVHLLPILAVALPGVLLLLFLFTRPEILVPASQKQHLETVFNVNIEDRFNAGRNAAQKDLDFLLEKIHAKGISSLSKDELDQLADLSDKLK